MLCYLYFDSKQLRLQQYNDSNFPYKASNKFVSTRSFRVRKMFGAVSDEMEVKVAASEAWKVYGTLRLAQLVREQLSEFVHKIDVLEGDGGAGTVLQLTFPPGPSGSSQYKEKFTVVDDEKRVKVAEVIEGGYLEKGLDLYRVRFEVIEKQRQGEGEDSCITKTTVEYETKDLAAANLAVASIQVFMAIMTVVADYLTKNKTNN